MLHGRVKIKWYHCVLRDIDISSLFKKGVPEQAAVTLVIINTL